MADRFSTLASSLGALDRTLVDLRPRMSPVVGPTADRWRADAAALRFHLRPMAPPRPLLAILGGTGTGKSTLLNRLLDRQVSAASFRRTFTSGPVAVLADTSHLPADWLGLPAKEVAESAWPVRGESGVLTVVACPHHVTRNAVAVDTPDLDGDQPHHHAEAERVFRWATAVLFVVTPEKYQMPDLLAYYRLARRYELPTLFVMNKCEQQDVLDDYQRQLAGHGHPDAVVFAVPRDDAGWEPPQGIDLIALRSAVASLPQDVACIPPHRRQQAMARRTADLLDRLRDGVIDPLVSDSRQARQLMDVLRAMHTPAPGVDVSPITAELQQRMREKSWLYLAGPQRMLHWVRRTPALLVRLPRAAWDAVMFGQAPRTPAPERPPAATDPQTPDLRQPLVEQLSILQTRIHDAILGTPAGRRWLAADPQGFAATRIQPAEAARIAEEEVAALRQWCQEHWDKAPRDTRLLNRLLRLSPASSTVATPFEAAPWLMFLLAITPVFTMGTDLAILGVYHLAVTLLERLSNEVKSRTRKANARIEQRFEELGRRQIDDVCAWLERMAPSQRDLDALVRQADAVNELVESERSHG